jgi:para-nitrobenzyl esterase
MEKRMSDMTQHPVVQLKDGAIRGKVDSGAAAFLGIPYAAPPFGPNRMRAPQSVQPWEGERDATAFGPTVPKGDYPPQYAPLFPEVVIPGEDCLNLNVWTPDPDASGLPVLVWVHGGSFMNGSSSVAEYNGAAFARDGIVCVTINYRLAAEGFLFLGDGIANLGLLDQLAALRWVQGNIAAFGGDPARVTVAGESAGAMSVTTLLSMPLAEGLFAQAIAQSGAGAHTLTQDQAAMVGGYLAAALEVPADRDSIRAVPLDTLVQTASDLVVGVQTNPDPAKWGQLALSLLPFAPVVDGSVLPAVPITAFAAGQGSGVPLLIGSNRDEARLFLVAAASIDLIDDAGLGAVAGAYGLSEDDLAVYRGNRPDASPGDLLAAVISDWFFRIPAIRVAEARATAGTPGTWMYRFDRPEPEDNHRLGACHGAEIPFVFDTITLEELHPRLGDTPSRTVADQVHKVWVNFITRGDPGWAAYHPASRTTALLAERIEAADDPAGDERACWDGIR